MTTPPTLLTSHFFWVNYFEKHPEVYSRLAGVGRTGWVYPEGYARFRRVFTRCPFCDGSGVKNFPAVFPVHKYVAVDSVYCVCETLRILGEPRNGESRLIGEYPWSKFQFNYEAWDKSKTPMKTTIANLQKWTTSPFQWLYLWGQKGSGKTSALHAMKQTLGNLAYFITASDLQARAWAVMENNGDSQGKIVADLAHAPILLIDDLGAEHAKGDFTYSILYAAINKRVAFGRMAPVVVTSNLSPEDILQSQNSNLQRVADRILDSQIGAVALFNQKSARTGQ